MITKFGYAFPTTVKMDGVAIALATTASKDTDRKPGSPYCKGEMSNVTIDGVQCRVYISVYRMESLSVVRGPDGTVTGIVPSAGGTRKANPASTIDAKVAKPAKRTRRGAKAIAVVDAKIADECATDPNEVRLQKMESRIEMMLTLVEQLTRAK